MAQGLARFRLPPERESNSVLMQPERRFAPAIFLFFPAPLRPATVRRDSLSDFSQLRLPPYFSVSVEGSGMQPCINCLGSEKAGACGTAVMFSWDDFKDHKGLPVEDAVDFGTKIETLCVIAMSRQLPDISGILAHLY